MRLLVAISLQLVILILTTGSESSNIRRLLEWVRGLNSGADGLNPKTTVQSIPGMGLGIVADTNVKVKPPFPLRTEVHLHWMQDFIFLSIFLQSGEWVTRTPLSAVINIEHAFASEEFGPVADHIESITGNTNMKALFVAMERLRGDESFWGPYLASLPHRIHTSLLFDKRELDELQTSMVGSSSAIYTIQ